MNIRTRFIVVCVTVAALFATGVSPAQAAPSIVRHYGSGLAMSGQSECGKALSARAGAWMCPVSTSVAKPKKLAGMTPMTGTCSVIGCWYYNANYWAELDGEGAYGYGGTTLGDTYFYIEIKFSGSKSTDLPFQFESSRTVKTLAASGERLYFSSAQPNGKGVDGGASFKTWSSGVHAGDTLVSIFGAGGYSYTEASTVQTAGVASQYQWTDPTYPGTWWVYYVSPKFIHQSSGTYWMSDPYQICENWWGSGWDAP